MSDYDRIGKVSVISAAVGPSEDNRMSQGAGRSSYYTARSFAVGPSEQDKMRSMAAGSERSMRGYDMVSQGAGNTSYQSKVMKSMGAGNSQYVPSKVDMQS
jgi:hypothetical protein